MIGSKPSFSMYSIAAIAARWAFGGRPRPRRSRSRRSPDRGSSSMYSRTASVPTPISWPVCGSAKWPRSSHASFQSAVRSRVCGHDSRATASGRSIWSELLPVASFDRTTRRRSKSGAGWRAACRWRSPSCRRAGITAPPVLLFHWLVALRPIASARRSRALWSRISAVFCLVHALVTPVMRPNNASLTACGRLTRALPRSRKFEPWRGQVDEDGDRVVVFNVGVLQTLFEVERRTADGWAEVEAFDDVQAFAARRRLGIRTPPRSRRARRRASISRFR